MFWNWVFRWILAGPAIRLIFWTRVVGRENLPKHGPAIFALGPHRTQIESLIVASCLPRYWLQFFAKSGYWEKHPILGRVMTAIGLIQLTRSGGRAVVEQISKGLSVLEAGGFVAMYPEATRGYDRYVHKGYPGIASISLRAGGVMIIPMGLRKMRPEGFWHFLRIRVIVIGEPIRPLALHNPQHHKVAEAVLERVSKSALTRQVMEEISRLSGSPYIDEALPVPGG